MNLHRMQKSGFLCKRAVKQANGEPQRVLFTGFFLNNLNLKSEDD